jgi:anti-anti-sigma factor
VSDIEQGGRGAEFWASWQVTSYGVIVTVVGEIDSTTAKDLDLTMRDAVQYLTPPDTLALDMRRTSFIGSMGLGLLVRWHRRCADAGSPFILVAPSATVMRVLRIVGLDSVLTIRTDL